MSQTQSLGQNLHAGGGCYSRLSQQALSRFDDGMKRGRRSGQRHFATPGSSFLFQQQNEPLGKDLVVIEFFNQSLDIAHEPGGQACWVDGGLAQAATPADALVERSSSEDGLSRSAMEFPPQCLPFDGQQSAYEPTIRLGKVPTGHDAVRGELIDAPFPNPGDFPDRHPFQKRVHLVWLQQHPTAEWLGRVGQQFGQGLRGRDAHANRYADLLQNPLLQ